MSAWAPLSDNPNMQALLTIRHGNTHKSVCACCGAVEHRPLGVAYTGSATGFVKQEEPKCDLCDDDCYGCPCPCHQDMRVTS